MGFEDRIFLIGFGKDERLDPFRINRLGGNMSLPAVAAVRASQRRYCHRATQRPIRLV